MSDCHELMKQAWIDYPSQDNEGFQPDRGGFKCGWFMAWNHQQKRIDQLEDLCKIKDKQIKEKNRLLLDVYDYLDVENEGVSKEVYKLVEKIRKSVGM